MKPKPEVIRNNVKYPDKKESSDIFFKKEITILFQHGTESRFWNYVGGKFDIDRGKYVVVEEKKEIE